MVARYAILSLLALLVLVAEGVGIVWQRLDGRLVLVPVAALLVLQGLDAVEDRRPQPYDNILALFRDNGAPPVQVLATPRAAELVRRYIAPRLPTDFTETLTLREMKEMLPRLWETGPAVWAVTSAEARAELVDGLEGGFVCHARFGVNLVSVFAREQSLLPSGMERCEALSGAE
jgi:hypothetical protein